MRLLDIDFPRQRSGSGFVPSRVRVAEKLAELLCDARDLFALSDELRSSDALLAGDVEALARSVYDRSDTLLTKITQ